MKKEDLFDAVTEIDDRHIDHAARHSFRRSFAWKQLGALAACGVLLIGLARFAPSGGSDAAASAPAASAPAATAPEAAPPAAGPSAPLLTQDLFIPPNTALHLLSHEENAQTQIPSFALFFNETHYFLSESDGICTIYPRTNEVIDADCGLTIMHCADTAPDAAAAQELLLLSADYQTVVDTETAVRTDDISLHADGGGEAGALQGDVSVVSDGVGGAFVLTARYTEDAAQTHGLHFLDMIASFYVASDPDALPDWLTALQETTLETAAVLFSGQETDTQNAYGADVRKDLSIASIDYTVDTPLTPAHAIVSIEHRIGTDDSFSYLTLELTYAEEIWTVTFAGLEK